MRPLKKLFDDLSRDENGMDRCKMVKPEGSHGGRWKAGGWELGIAAAP